MVIVGIVVVALVILFALTTLALASAGRLERSARAILALGGAALIGNALLFLG